MLPDINDLDLLNEVVEVGEGDAEEFFQAPLPDDGEHVAVLHLGDRGVTIARQRNKQTGDRTGAGFVNVHLVARILSSSGEEGIAVFDNPTSIVMQSGMSKLHAILDIVGSPAPHRSTLQELKEHVEAVLAQSPQVGIVTQWEAQINRGTKDSPNYVTLLKGQKRFPFNDDTNKWSPDVEDPETSEMIRAQARILRYKRV